MKFDDVLERVGDFGGYQRLLVGLLYIPALFSGMQALSYVFISAIPKHRCFVNTCDAASTSFREDFLNATTPFDQSSSTYSTCTLYGMATAHNNSDDDDDTAPQMWPLRDDAARVVRRHDCPSYVVDYNVTARCHRWKFDQSTYLSTVVTQWKLVCDRSNLVALSQSAYMLGVMLGSIIFGCVADRFGRKNAIIVAILFAASCATLIPFVPLYSVFLVLKVVVGASCQGFYQTIFVMSVEVVGKSKRAFCGILVSIYFSLGEVILGILAFHIRDWKLLQLTISAPMLFFLTYYWIIPESPRWMISNRRFSCAKKILEKIAKSNNRTVPYDLLNAEDTDLVDVDASLGKPLKAVTHHSMLDLFRTPRLRWRTINIIFNWFMNTVAYYGITMSTPYLGGNEFSTFVIVSAIEVPAYVFSILVLDRIGRRVPLCLCMIVGGIAGMCTTFIPTTKAYLLFSIALALIAKFGAAAAFGIIYVFTAELFPTVIRNNGIGLSSMLGHIGGVISPYIAMLNVYHPALPLMTCGVFSLVAGVLALTLPETLNQQLPDSIEDAEDFGRKNHRKVVTGSAQSERFCLLSGANDGDAGESNPTQ